MQDLLTTIGSDHMKEFGKAAFDLGFYHSAKPMDAYGTASFTLNSGINKHQLTMIKKIMTHHCHSFLFLWL